MAFVRYFDEGTMTVGEQFVDEGAELAECGICGRNKPVCCDEGYYTAEDGAVVHVGAVCVDCCPSKKGRGRIWDGKSVAGGTYERCE